MCHRKSSCLLVAGVFLLPSGVHLTQKSHSPTRALGEYNLWPARPSDLLPGSPDVFRTVAATPAQLKR